MENNFNQNNQENNQQMYGQQQTAYNQQPYNQQPYNQQQQVYNQQPYAQQYNYQQPNYGQTRLTRKEFVNLPQMNNVKNQLFASIGIIYFCVVLNIVLVFLAWLPYTAFLDIVILLVTGIGIHLTYNKIFGIIILVYSILDVLLFLIVYGQFGGWLILVAGILGFMSTMKFDKAWGEYVNTGRIPTYIK